MLLFPNASKIRTDHLDRPALIYVRQSTFMQVRLNTGSTARQYDMQQRALDLGWSPEQIVIIDQDQGCSGASAMGQAGFQYLIAEVGLGRAGAVFSLEASRLARASSDWYRLIEICALTDTLVADEEGVYDPGLYVVKHFAEHHLLFPTRLRHGGRAGELIWRTLTHGRVLAILHNPAYAGTYVFGRTKTHPQLLPGETVRIKGHIHPVKREEWPIVLHDTHPGYISWDQFLRNQQRLDDNRTFRHEERRGAVREGAALLQGIALCGCCGRRMTIRYLNLDNGLIPSYDCNQLHKQLAGKTCQNLRGDGIDVTVAEIFLAAMQPAQLEVSLAALAQLEARAQQIDRQWQLRLERATYEADLARRRFMAVDPDNRLVARSLERDWNTKLAEVERLEREYTALPQPAAQLVSPPERQRILALAQDLPTLWHAPTTTAAERKQLLRFLIKDVTLTRQKTTIHIGIRWQTEAVTELEIARPSQATPLAIVDRIRELAPTHPDLQVAALLNQEGYLTGKKRPFTANSVEWVRHKHHIALGRSARPDSFPNGQREDGRYTARAAAELLNVDVSTIADWCQSGRLEAIQTKPHCPRWIKLTPEIIAALRKPTRQHRSRRAAAASGGLVQSGCGTFG